MNNYIKTLINANKEANENIKLIEDSIRSAEIVDEKTKANYGNLCVALRGYRMVADATECMLINEDCIKDENGEFYQKLNTEIPTTENKAGSDFDVDKK